MNKISMSAILLSGLTLASTPAFSAISTFDADRDGWTVEGDSVTSLLNWSATGGNPDGHVWISDLALGPDIYFLAPTKFLGNQSGTLGTNLTFDLKHVIPTGVGENPYYAPDVILQSNDLTAVFDIDGNNNPAYDLWSNYSVPLNALGWKVGSLDGAAVSEQQFASLLANLTGLKIRGEFRYGEEIAYLDNVNMAPVPVPPAFALFATGLISWFGVFKRKRNA